MEILTPQNLHTGIKLHICPIIITAVRIFCSQKVRWGCHRSIRKLGSSKRGKNVNKSKARPSKARSFLQTGGQSEETFMNNFKC